MTHFPVTTNMWRGVRGPDVRLNRPLVRACDWEGLEPTSASYVAPTCPDCTAYAATLDRLGYLRRR